MKRLRLLASLAAVALFPTLRSHADVTLPRMLSSHMVLQRDRPIHLWGWADPGEPVTATLKDKSATVKTDELGRWSLYLPAERAGGPYQVTIAGRNRIVLDDVLIGDVWFASGQSNMEFPLLGFGPDTPLANGAEEIRNATQPQIRLMLVDRVPSPFPLQDVNTDPQGSSPKGWTLCTPETAAHFSAAAYFFGREIATKEHVPVGLIDSSWGGTPAEAWVSMQGLADPALSSVFAQWARESANLADVPRMQAEEKREDEAAAAAGRPKPQHPWHPDMRSWDPAWLYNGMIAPFTPMPIKGVIWYQGETNSSVERALDYQRIFPALIEDWRRHWGQGDFPFLFAQISSFRSTASEDWPVIREAQRRTLKLAKTAMAVTIDIGNPANVHPADKQDVGHRLALAAEAVAYGAPVEDSGPLFREATPVGGAIEVRFDHGEGLTAKGGELTGFEVAGQDRNFVKAEAKIGHGEGGEFLTVSSPAVAEPVYVRYGWQNAPSPTLNLYNAAGLPASPFTSEQEIPAPDPAHPTN